MLKEQQSGSRVVMAACENVVTNNSLGNFVTRGSGSQRLGTTVHHHHEHILKSVSFHLLVCNKVAGYYNVSDQSSLKCV